MTDDEQKHDEFGEEQDGAESSLATRDLQSCVRWGVMPEQSLLPWNLH